MFLGIAVPGKSPFATFRSIRIEVGLIKGTMAALILCGSVSLVGTSVGTK